MRICQLLEHRRENAGGETIRRLIKSYDRGVVRRVLNTAMPFVPERALLIANRYPRIRNLLRDALTEAPGTGLAEGKIGRGPARGQPIQVDMASDERRLIAGTYEPWIHNLLPHILREGMSMWDVGAHIGYYVITACALSPTGHHLAVEPDPANAERLRHNLALNSLTVEVIGAAVSDRVHNVRFESNSALGRIRENGDRTVPAVPLDALLNEHAPPQLVMMDIEGAEGIVIPAATRFLDEVRPTWLIELHGEGGAAAYETLVDHGYAVRQSQPGDAEHLATLRSHALFTPL
jgi:FkbM family methyltransferase